LPERGEDGGVRENIGDLARVHGGMVRVRDS
jgi:hypothetical protein